MNHVKNILILILCILISGCESFSKRHATRAILLVEEREIKKLPYHDNESSVPEVSQNRSKISVGPRKIYSLPKNSGLFQYSGNPIFIHGDTKFSIRLDEIGAGWLYKEIPKDSFREVDDFNFQEVKRNLISKEDFDHFRGRELWLLTTISSLNTNDPLETKSKQYFKATNVKFDAQSYALVPLDSEEKFIFTHESDMSYRIKMQLYSINNFEVKKELAKIAKNPGVIGVGKALIATLKNTVGAVAGDVIESTLNSKAEEGLALERFLLSIDAIEEFRGEALVLRGSGFDKRKASISLSADSLEDIKSNIKNEEDKKLINDIVKNSNTSENFIYFSSPIIQTSYMLLDFFKTKPMQRCDKKYNLESKLQDFNKYSGLKIENDMVLNSGFTGCTEIIGSDKKTSQEEVAITGDDLRKYSYLKFSVIESPSAKSYIDNTNMVAANNVHLSSYTSSLDQLMKAIYKSNISQLEMKYNSLGNDVAAAYAACLDPQNCPEGDKLSVERGKIKSQYENEIRNSAMALDAINYVKKEMKFDEWHQHLMRPAD